MNTQRSHRDGPEYWRAVTAGEVRHHPVPKEDVFQCYLDRLDIGAGDRVLDVGIGYGRFVPFYLSKGATVCGLDIDPAMARAAEATYGDAVQVTICDVGHVPLADGTFDRVVCWAVFEELDQTAALGELSRLLTAGGRLLLTGKNDLYEIDDDEALAAEIGARAKNHPNLFTRLSAVDWRAFGFRPVFERYYRRRGDFARDFGEAERPERFYEFLVILERIGIDERPQDGAPVEIGVAFSRTFLEVRGRNVE